MLAAALVAKDYYRIGRYMQADLFHEPFRAQLIPLYVDIVNAAKANGAFGTALSGAGPTMISMIPSNIGSKFVRTMEELFPSHKIILTKVAPVGVNVTEYPIVSK